MLPTSQLVADPSSLAFAGLVIMLLVAFSMSVQSKPGSFVYLAIIGYAYTAIVTAINGTVILAQGILPAAAIIMGLITLGCLSSALQETRHARRFTVHASLLLLSAAIACCTFADTALYLLILISAPGSPPWPNAVITSIRTGSYWLLVLTGTACVLCIVVALGNKCIAKFR